MKEQQKSLERALEDAVSRALRDNLAPLQRTADELHQAYADLVAACSSTRPSNALPAMLRAQTAAAALAAGLSVLSNFVAVALNPREAEAAADSPSRSSTAVAEAEPPRESSRAAEEAESASERAEEPPESADVSGSRDEFAFSEPEAPAEAEAVVELDEPAEEPPEEAAVPPAKVPAPSAFDVATLPAEMQELHRRANRVAKVAMQDIKMLRPKDVRLGCEHKDVCNRLRSDLDKARKEYDRRFRAIQDHPVDYFHRWMVDILAEGDTEALGEYPYPSPVLRHS